MIHGVKFYGNYFWTIAVCKAESHLLPRVSSGCAVPPSPTAPSLRHGQAPLSFPVDLVAFPHLLVTLFFMQEPTEKPLKLLCNFEHFWRWDWGQEGASLYSRPYPGSTTVAHHLRLLVYSRSPHSVIKERVRVGTGARQCQECAVLCPA